MPEEDADKKQSSHVKRILEERKKDAKIDPLLEAQFKAGRLLAAITSRPGQSGRADGYILEGKELDVSGSFDSSMTLYTDGSTSSTTGSSRSARLSMLPRRLQVGKGCRSGGMYHERTSAMQTFYMRDGEYHAAVLNEDHAMSDFPADTRRSAIP